MLNHVDVFQKYVDMVIYETLKEKERKIQDILESETYRMGRLILSPWKKISQMLKRDAGPSDPTVKGVHKEREGKE